jgi:hypothetical protein
VEVTLQDIALANRLAHDVLGRSLDELPPQTRRVLGLIEAFVVERAQQQEIPRSGVRFTRRELRARCGMSDAAIRVHLERLVMMEYLRPAAGRNGLRFEYELLFDGDVETSAPQMIGLIDIGQLATTTATSQGQDPDLAPRLRAARTHLAPALQGVQREENSSTDTVLATADADESQRARLRSLPAKHRNRTARASAPSSEISLLAAETAGG